MLWRMMMIWWKKERRRIRTSGQVSASIVHSGLHWCFFSWLIHSNAPTKNGWQNWGRSSWWEWCSYLFFFWLQKRGSSFKVWDRNEGMMERRKDEEHERSWTRFRRRSHSRCPFTSCDLSFFLLSFSSFPLMIIMVLLLLISTVQSSLTVTRAPFIPCDISCRRSLVTPEAEKQTMLYTLFPGTPGSPFCLLFSPHEGQLAYLRVMWEKWSVDDDETWRKG